MHAIEVRGHAFPPVYRILPKIVVFWNFIKGGVDEYSRTLKKWKPNFNSMHPYAFLWIRLIMSLTSNCHLIFRLFKIENKLHTFTCIEQLKEALNKLGSLQHSLFQFAERLHLTTAIHPEHHSLSSSTATSTGACMPRPCDTSKNQTKLEWWNSSDGIERRNQEGAHIPISYPSKVYKYCLICHSHTKYHCSKCALKDPECTVPACISISYNRVGESKCLKTCMEILHSNGNREIKADFGRIKKSSPSQKAAALANGKKGGAPRRAPKRKIAEVVSVDEDN